MVVLYGDSDGPLMAPWSSRLNLSIIIQRPKREVAGTILLARVQSKKARQADKVNICSRSSIILGIQINLNLDGQRKSVSLTEERGIGMCL